MEKKIITFILAVTLIVAGIAGSPVKAVADSADTPVYAAADAYSIADYWSESTKTAPYMAGYVFGGWYVYEGGSYVALREDDLSDALLGTLTARAKFVPADVLSVKSQLASLSETGGLGKLRLLTTTDSLNYSKVGFQYRLGSGDLQEAETGTVYSAIDANGGSLQYPSTAFVSASNYFAALELTNIAVENFANTIYAKPFWVTLDGTRVTGLPRLSRVEDNQNGYTSVAINLFSDGLTSSQVAAGKVVATFNTTDFDVALVSETYKVDTDMSVFAEIDFGVDEENGTITFVGNAPTAGTNVSPDGMLANIRFVNTTGTGSLDFEVTETTFYNWNEQAINTIDAH
ncbi:MAG: hypothetical protein IJU01_01125 [Lachnospiraceae bacterium]|nr:hypothetical protein [Lachnospiraceae bacterium]MBR6270763.1 hypothetical protein [Lachnospiraceae bacterium]